MRSIFYISALVAIISFFLSDPDKPQVVQPAPKAQDQIEKPGTPVLETLGIGPEKDELFVVDPVPTKIVAPVEDITPAKPEVLTVRYVTASALNVRDSPSTNSTVKDQIRFGDSVQVLEDLGDWTKVQHAGQELWVARRYLDIKAPSPPVVQPTPAATTARRGVPVPTTSEIRQAREAIIRQSRASYAGSCPCPYDRDRAGRRCGGRSAWSRPGGASPICYADDVSQSRLESYFARRR